MLFDIQLKYFCITIQIMLIKFQMVLLSTSYIVGIDHNSNNMLIGMNAKVKSLSYCLRKTAHRDTKAILRMSKNRTVVSSWKVFVTYISSRLKSLLDIVRTRVYCMIVEH